VKRFILVVSLLLSVTIIFTSCSKSGEYKLRPAKSSEIGTQAICPVTSNVFNVSKETQAVDYKGKTYFLCCPDCSVDFQKKLGLVASNDSKEMSDMKNMESAKDTPPVKVDAKTIMYWTCPMHPQIKEKNSGQCPICGMDLEPVYKKEGNRIGVDIEKGKLLGLKSETARVIEVSKKLRLPASVAFDNDLYIVQQEYLSNYKKINAQAKDQNDILKSAKFRLTLLGYTDNDIKELEKQTQPDKTLLYPGDKVWMFADIYSGDLQTIKPGKNVVAVTDTYPSSKFYGKIIFVEPSINSETHSAKARIVVEDKKNLLKLGMYANIDVEISGGQLLAVPKTALINTGMRSIVYIDYGNGEYEPIDVKTGFVGDDYVEIKSGLKAGDLVVTNGNFMLDSESQLHSSSNQSSMPGMDMGNK